MKRSASRRCLRWLAIALMTWAWFGILPARAQDANAVHLKQITALLHGLPDDIARIQRVIDHVPLKPLTIRGRCEYGCFLGLFCKELNWNLSRDLSAERPALQARLGELASHSRTFDQVLAIISLWLVTDLPASDALLREQLENIEKAGRDVPVKMPLIAEAVNRVTVRIGQDSDRLGMALRALAAFSQEQQYLVARIRQTHAELVESWKRNTWATEIARMPCGRDDAQRQYTGIHYDMEGFLAVMNNSFAGLEQRVPVAGQAIDSLIGTLHNLVLNYAGIVEKLRWAEDGVPLGNNVLRLRLAVVQAAWDELKSHARDHLQ